MGVPYKEAHKFRGKSMRATLFTQGIASPDVHVREGAQQIVMYFHGLEGYDYQCTRVAVSRDGINFKALPENIGRTYFRVFKY